MSPRAPAVERGPRFMRKGGVRLARFAPPAGLLLVIAMAALPGCAAAPRAAQGSPAAPVGPAVSGGAAASSVTLTFLATTDVHGHVEAEQVELTLDGGRKEKVLRGGLELFGGYVRSARERSPGHVVLLDSGDMLQGTMISNLGEGAAMVHAMNALGYDAAAVGNHEFDFGPVGPASVPSGPGDDPRGVIAARAAEARYPWLSANVVRVEDGGPLAPGVRPLVVLDVDGVKVGVVGGTTEDVPRTTRARNLVGLRVEPLARALPAAAEAARAAGATIVVAVIHEGGECARFDAPDDPASCRDDAEIFKLARALPPGTLDAIFGGHTHQAVAARVNGIAILQAYAEARAFSRLDLTVDRTSGRPVPGGVVIHPPTPVCSAVADGGGDCDPRRARGAATVPVVYEGRAVSLDAAVSAAIAPDVARVAEERARPVGVTLSAPLTRRYRDESALGNLAADAFRHAARSRIGLTNGGGLRADLPAGALTRGALFQAFPFDNRLALLRVRGDRLRALLEKNLAGEHGILSLSGLTARARCEGTRLRAELRLDDGRPLDDTAEYTVATSDFLAQGGDDFGVLSPLPPGSLTIDEDGPIMRDLVADELRRRGPVIAGDRSLFDPEHPRVVLPRPRPFPCGGATDKAALPAPSH